MNDNIPHINDVPEQTRFPGDGWAPANTAAAASAKGDMVFVCPFLKVMLQAVEMSGARYTRHDKEVRPQVEPAQIKHYRLNSLVAGEQTRNAARDFFPIIN
jgi:hypothetical protein